MADKLSLTETRAFLAGELKKTLADHTARMETIREREQKARDKKASKLAKAEKTCKGCGKKFDSVSATPSEYCGGCNRKPKNDKGEVRKGGDLMTPPDSGMPSSMGMSEKMGKGEKKFEAHCTGGCGDVEVTRKQADKGRCPHCNRDLEVKEPVEDQFEKNAQAGYGPNGEDMSLSEMCKSCGKPGGLCKCSTCKSELGKSDKMFGAKPGKSVKKDEKSVATANKELKGFKSLATNPTAPFKTKQGAMVKDELPAVKAVPAKKVSGAKLPGMPKKVDTTEGSGGDVKKGLKKGAMDVALGMKKPVPHDPMAVHSLKLPGMKQTPPPVPKVNGMHPATAQSLHAVGVGMHPETRSSLAALPKPPTAPKGVVGVGGKQPVGMGGGDAHKIAAQPPPIPAAARKDEMDPKMHGFSRPTDIQGRKHPIDAGGWPAGTESWADRSPVMQAVKQKVATPAAEPSYAPGSGTGPVRQQRSSYAGVRGMAALARGEVPAGEKVPEKKSVLAVKPTKLQRGLSMINHNRRLA